MRLALTCVVAFVFGYVGSIPLAGPIAVLILSRAAQRRYGEALRIGLGAAMAEGAYAGIAYFAFAALLARQHWVQPVSRGATAIILVGLGVYFMFWHPKPQEKDARESKAGTVLLGFTVSALNPTLLLTWSAAVAFVYSKGLGGEPPWVALLFGGFACAGIALWMVCLTWLLRRYGGRVPEGAMIWVIRAMGVGLLALGVWSGVQFASWAIAGRRSSRRILRPSLVATRSDSRDRERLAMLDPWAICFPTHGARSSR